VNELEHVTILDVNSQYAVKPTHTVISIKQSPVLKGYLLLVLSLNISYELNVFLEATCIRRLHVLCSKGDLL